MGKYLARAFPNEYCSIAKKRLIEAEFDEICAHFEELSSLLYDSDTSRSQHLSDGDILASLDGLREEIANSLMKQRHSVDWN